MLTDYPLQNASYACLRNFTVGYTLPATAARKIKLSGVRFMCRAVTCSIFGEVATKALIRSRV